MLNNCTHLGFSVTVEDSEELSTSKFSRCSFYLIRLWSETWPNIHWMMITKVVALSECVSAVTVVLDSTVLGSGAVFILGSWSR